MFVLTVWKKRVMFVMMRDLDICGVPAWKEIKWN